MLKQTVIIYHVYVIFENGVGFVVTEGIVRAVGAFSINLLWCNGLFDVDVDDVGDGDGDGDVDDDDDGNSLFILFEEQVFASGCNGGIEPICVSIELLLCWWTIFDVLNWLCNDNPLYRGSNGGGAWAAIIWDWDSPSPSLELPLELELELEFELDWDWVLMVVFTVKPPAVATADTEADCDNLDIPESTDIADFDWGGLLLNVAVGEPIVAAAVLHIDDAREEW